MKWVLCVSLIIVNIGAMDQEEMVSNAVFNNDALMKEMNERYSNPPFRCEPLYVHREAIIARIKKEMKRFSHSFEWINSALADIDEPRISLFRIITSLSRYRDRIRGPEKKDQFDACITDIVAHSVRLCGTFFLNHEPEFAVADYRQVDLALAVRGAVESKLYSAARLVMAAGLKQTKAELVDIVVKDIQTKQSQMRVAEKNFMNVDPNWFAYWLNNTQQLRKEVRSLVPIGHDLILLLEKPGQAGDDDSPFNAAKRNEYYSCYSKAFATREPALCAAFLLKGADPIHYLQILYAEQERLEKEEELSSEKSESFKKNELCILTFERAYNWTVLNEDYTLARKNRPGRQKRLIRYNHALPVELWQQLQALYIESAHANEAEKDALPLKSPGK